MHTTAVSQILASSKHKRRCGGLGLDLTMNGTKTEAVLIHENGEKQELT